MSKHQTFDIGLEWTPATIAGDDAPQTVERMGVAMAGGPIGVCLVAPDRVRAMIARANPPFEIDVDGLPYAVEELREPAALSDPLGCHLKTAAVMRMAQSEAAALVRQASLRGWVVHATSDDLDPDAAAVWRFHFDKDVTAAHALHEATLGRLLRASSAQPSTQE